MVELTDEEIAQEEEFLRGVPRLNIGALFLPPIWGPAHGIWATILYYPLWLFADNMFYAAYVERSAFSLIFALVLFVSLLVGTIAFSLVSQPLALHRAVSKGVDKETYLKRERIWAVVCVVVGVIMLTAATYYNLLIRPSISSW